MPRRCEPDKFAFRPLAEDDLPLLHRWLNHGEVLRWYGQRHSTLEEVVAKYTPRITGESPTRSYLVLYDEHPIGYVQSYRISAYPSHSGHMIPDTVRGAAALDVFIGDDDYLHQGFGAPLLRRFMRDVIFATMDVPVCVIDPEPDNAAAIRAYEKAGFRHVMTVEQPEAEESAYVMVIRREDVMGQAPNEQ